MFIKTQAGYDDELIKKYAPFLELYKNIITGAEQIDCNDSVESNYLGIRFDSSVKYKLMKQRLKYFEQAKLGVIKRKIQWPTLAIVESSPKLKYYGVPVEVIKEMKDIKTSNRFARVFGEEII